MFVAVAFEFSTDDHREAIYNLIGQYGFKRITKDVFESTSMSEISLTRLKKDIDRITDFYDIVRFYQYPVDNTLVITSLKEKKWRRLKVLA